MFCSRLLYIFLSVKKEMCKIKKFINKENGKNTLKTRLFDNVKKYIVVKSLDHKV